ncbi:unnamed protein product [Moneuplotes crassus]|uniref:Uncharacterized protein n=1 Tax=Euplotes crassus TaxID=5936 RepID=A0AAD1US21_EUPCR|nr:unnamed protein product [Moneuplotes crassus]
MSDQGTSGAKEISIQDEPKDKKNSRKKGRSLNPAFKSCRRHMNKSGINMTYFPALKLSSQSNNIGISIQSTSKNKSSNKFGTRSHANSPENMSFTAGEEEIDSVPILQRKIIQKKKPRRYKSKKNSPLRQSSLLPPIPADVVPKLGELNYFSKLNKKEYEHKVKLLQNRIQKLKKEEKKANLKIKQTSERAEQYIKTRNKYYEEQKRIISHRLQVQKHTESKRKEIIRNKESRKKNMQELKQKLLEESKKRRIQQKKERNKALKAKCIELEKEHLQRKIANAKLVKEEEQKVLQIKLQHENENHLSLQNNYYKRYIKDEEHTERNKQMIHKLEQTESKILEKLQSTMEKQVTMHKTLEELVKTGNSEGNISPNVQ